jgi:hypothetical protein
MTHEEKVRENYRQQGRKQEQERIIRLMESLMCNCRFGYPESERKYYKTSGNQTRESLWDEQMWYSGHQYCNGWDWLIPRIKGESQ